MTASSTPAWGPWCDKCGHPASYHGMTFCMVMAGATDKRLCDCDGYRFSDFRFSDPARSAARAELTRREETSA